MAQTMAPAPELLTAVTPTDRITAGIHPTVAFRRDIRNIASWRNAVSIASVYAQFAAVVATAVWSGDHLPIWAATPIWAVAFILCGRTQAQVAILMHEAAHRLLFANRRLNDAAGTWLLAYPGFVPFLAYRSAHLAHHRDELGPAEPDIPLYRGYPIARASLRRKLTRDALGITGVKLLRPLFGALRSHDRDTRTVGWSIVAAQAVLLAVFAAAGHPWLYLVFWLGPHLTVWRVLNRLRGIAEHGGMIHSPDKRASTHVVAQSFWPRFFIAPFRTGWHLAHHVDPGIPFRNLAVLHGALVDADYIGDGLEWPSYRALWRAMAAG